MPIGGFHALALLSCATVPAAEAVHQGSAAHSPALRRNYVERLISWLRRPIGCPRRLCPSGRQFFLLQTNRDVSSFVRQVALVRRGDPRYTLAPFVGQVGGETWVGAK